MSGLRDSNIATYSGIGGETPPPDTLTQKNSDPSISGDPTTKTHGFDIPDVGSMSITHGASGVEININNGFAKIGVSKSGHVTIDTQSSSGISISASQGTVALTAPNVLVKASGALKLEGSTVDISSKGDINLHTPTGHLGTTSQSMSSEVNGIYSIVAARDFGLLVGGNMRLTSAGDARVISSGLFYVDAKSDIKIRSDDEIAVNSQKSVQLYSREKAVFHSKDKMSIRSDSDMDLQTKTKMLQVAVGDFTINTKGKMTQASTGLFNISSKFKLNLVSDDDLKINSNGGLYLSADSVLQMFSSDNMSLDSGSEIHLEMGEANNLQMDSDDPSDAGYAQAPEKAQYEQSETIQKTISSNMDAPGIPGNLGGIDAGGGTIGHSGIGRTTNGGAYGGPGGSADLSTVDQKLQDIYNCAKGKYEAATGHKVNLISTLRPGDNDSFHGKGQALDVSISGSSGKVFGNYQGSVDADSFAVYETFAHQMKQCEQELHPDSQLTWGGYFWNGGKGNYGAMDPMHFSVGGEGMGGGSWAAGAAGKQLSEWGISEFTSGKELTSTGFTGKPNYARVADKQPAPSASSIPFNGEGDQWKQGGKQVDQIPAGQQALEQKKEPNVEVEVNRGNR